MCTAHGYSQKEENTIKEDTLYIEQKKIDTDAMEAYKKSDDFKYETVKKEENLFQIFWNWIKRSIKKILSFFFDDITPAVGFLSHLLKIIPWLIAVIALYFIIKFFLKIDSKNIVEIKKNKAIIQLHEDEEVLLKQDLKALIKEAVEAKNFRLAIRYYYLYSLQKLSDKEFITWRQEKTNEDYIKEIRQHNIKPEFIETTRLYDFVWYGGFAINESEFNRTEALFHQLNQKIVE